MGTYGAPDQIPLGQYAPQNPYVPAVAYRGPYVGVPDGSGPISHRPSPRSRSHSRPRALAGACHATATLGEHGRLVHVARAECWVSPSSGCAVMPQGGYMKEAGQLRNVR